MDEMNNNHVLDATRGSVIRPLIEFSVPIMFANILQLFFNAADVIVVGQFVDETAVAAVGSTTSIISILVGLFTGLSVGATVVLSTKIGEGNRELEKIVQTTYTLGILLGIITAFVGFYISPFLLKLLNTPTDVIGQAEIYLQIYFLGQPGFMLYTFTRAVLAAKGDTKSPFIYLLISGIINVVLNVFLVVAAGLGVVGVAVATIASQYISAFLTLRKLVITDGAFHVEIRRFFLGKSEMKSIVKMGLPTGIQSTLVSVSGLLTQSSFNSLGTVIVAGQSASASIINFAAFSLNAFGQGCMTFISQNFGARKFDRVKTIYKTTLLIDVVLGSLFGVISIGFGKSLLSIYTPDSAAAVEAGMVGLTTTMSMAVMMGFYDTSGLVLRGLNHSAFPMITALFGNCVFRIFWILGIFNHLPASMEPLKAYRVLLTVYPVTWIIVFGINTVAYAAIMRRYSEKTGREAKELR